MSDVTWINWLVISLTILPFFFANLYNWQEVSFFNFFCYSALIIFPTSLVLLNSIKFWPILIFLISYFPLFYLSAQDLMRLEVSRYSLFFGSIIHFIWILNSFVQHEKPYLFFENIVLIMLVLISIKLVEKLRKRIVMGEADPIIIVISILGLTFEQSILWLFLVACLPILFFWKRLLKFSSTKIPFIPFCISAKLFAIVFYG
jgi:hypothetical protein